jgi:UDP-N-acetylmuramyl pentapeptide phosphotransferase/UDP-N-acetylglucosamine-1-phosphate transferase
MIGLLSDIKILNDPKKRFFLQLVVLIFFIFILNIKIIDTRNDFFNKLLINDYINKFFVIFCLMVLINGSNFVDGLNTLILTYYLCVFLIIFLFFKNIFFDIYLIKNLIIVLISIILFNIFGFIFLGDSGAYLISLFSGISLIHFAGYNTSVSPYFIILLFWYPCFELLFSMIRRSFFKKKLYNPDNMHLHQFLYLFLIKKLKLKNFSAQLLVSLMINFYRFNRI